MWASDHQVVSFIGLMVLVTSLHPCMAKWSGSREVDCRSQLFARANAVLRRVRRVETFISMTQPGLSGILLRVQLLQTRAGTECVCRRVHLELRAHDEDEDVWVRAVSSGIERPPSVVMVGVGKTGCRVRVGRDVTLEAQRMTGREEDVVGMVTGMRRLVLDVVSEARVDVVAVVECGRSGRGTGAGVVVVGRGMEVGRVRKVLGDEAIGVGVGRARGVLMAEFDGVEI